MDFACQIDSLNYLNRQSLDETGKLDLGAIYNQPDPRPYYSTLKDLDYLIPQFAKPVFQNVLETYRAAKKANSTKIVDLGCSYGVNAALLKCDMDMAELYGLYGSRSAGLYARDELIERDRRLFTPPEGEADIEIVGVDAAECAAAYAEEAEIIDGKVVANLEEDDLRPGQRELLKGTDLVISTGCVGYISETTLGKIVEATTPRMPWMVHFALRMFPFAPIREALAEQGYVTARGKHPFRQRRFASADEREHVLDRLADMGIDPSGVETDGWFYADLYVSRPVADAALVPASELTGA